MPQKYRDAREMVSVAIAGNMTRYPWEQCIDGMQQVFGMPLGLLFVDASFDEGSKATVCEKRNDGYYKEFRNLWMLLLSRSLHQKQLAVDLN